MTNGEKAIKTTYFSIFGNLALALIKGAAGYFGNSYALIANAIESTTDIFSSLLVLIGLKVSSKPADKNHPYGHGRAETLATFFVVGFLIVSAIIIATESIQNIHTPPSAPQALHANNFGRDNCLERDFLPAGRGKKQRDQQLLFKSQCLAPP